MQQYNKKRNRKIKLTNFQKQVYEIVRKIPIGKTLSYKKIAEKLNTSPRAVGQALKANPNPIKIPCHRVIHTNGKIGGYKFGKKKKLQLLKKEGVKINF